MRYTILSILFIGGLFGGEPSKPREAAEAYADENYEAAAPLFQESLELEDYVGQAQALNFNVGQSLLRQDSLTRGRTWFSKAIGPADKKLGPNESAKVASWAYNNVAVIQVKTQPGVQIQGSSPMALAPSGSGGQGQEDNIKEAINSLREALRLDPDNDIARYNYELLMRRSQQQSEQEQEQDEEKEDQQDQQQQNEKQEQNKQDQQQDNQQDQQKQNKPQPDNKENKGQNNPQQQDQQQTSEQMDQQQAKRLLEAVNEKEKQFIQELEESRPKGRPRRTDGPDW